MSYEKYPEFRGHRKKRPKKAQTHTPNQPVSQPLIQDPTFHETVARFQNDQEAYENFLTKVMKARHSLSTAQKILACMIIVTVAAGATYLIVQLFMRIEISLQSNRLTPDEQTRINKEVGRRIRVEPKFWKELQDPPLEKVSPTLRDQYKRDLAVYVKEITAFKEHATKSITRNAITTQTQKKVFDQPEVSIHITHKNGDNGSN
jgi:hypothetical protein